MMDIIDEHIPVVALTATATPKVQSDIVKNLGLRNPNIFISSFNRPNLYYEIQPKVKKDQTVKALVRFITNMPNKSGIIYTLNRKTTEAIVSNPPLCVPGRASAWSGARRANRRPIFAAALSGQSCGFVFDR